jgi:hypothetical protein
MKGLISVAVATLSLAGAHATKAEVHTGKPVADY